MGRRRRAKGTKHRLPEPADVLEGKVEIGAQELFDLIHRVNPTGRQLPGAEERRSYALKARLQSLLIRRFGDRHLVATPGEHDGVVSLAHRSGARDACHAVVSELDADSRSWVQRRLDVEAAPEVDDNDEGSAALGARRPSAAAPAAGGERADELLRRGREALEEYDYEAAERHLKLALEGSGGGTEAALALLDLLVGLLGMDRQGLEIEPRLGPRAKADPEVRALLALAEARVGDGERALELAASADGPRAAEAHVALAARAIQERHPEAAGRRLAAAAKLDPSHPRLRSLADDVAALRAERQRPAEEALEQRYLEQGFLATEDDARALLASWPESEVARRILHEVAVHRRAEEIAEHLEQGEKAFAKDRFLEAAAKFQAALDAGSERTDLPALIEKARAGERRRREAERVDAAVDRFSSAELKPALLGYLALPEALRERVRELRPGSSAGLLTWLEELGAPRSGAKAQAAAAAVLALERAIGELRHGRAQAALDELAAHDHVLVHVAEARDCLEEARSRVAAARRAQARETLGAARAAFEAARIERAGEQLKGLDSDVLTAGDRAAAEALLAEIRRLETVRRLELELERHLESEDLLGALERACELVERVPAAAEQERWRRRAGELRERIRTAWRLEVLAGDGPLDELRDFELSAFEDTPRYWLDDTGGELVLAAAWSDWLFLRVVDVERRLVTSRISLQTPEPLGRSLATCREGDRLRIAGYRGGLLELAVGSWDVLAWRSLRELLPAGVDVEAVILLPDSPLVWLRVRIDSSTWQLWIVDLRAWRVSRKLPEAAMVQPIVGDEPGVVVSSFQHGARLCTALGTAEGTEPLIRLHAHTAAIGPDGAGLVLALERPLLDSDPAPERMAEDDDPALDLMAGDDVRLMLALTDASKAGEAAGIASGIKLDDAFVDGTTSVATALDVGRSYALIQYGDSERELLSLAAPEQTFEVRHQVDVPFDTVLVQDRRSRHVAALMTVGMFFEVVPLGRGEPPVEFLPEPQSRDDRLLPIVGKVSFCGRQTGRSNAHVLALLGWWREMTGAELRKHVAAQVKKHAGDPDELVIRCLALKQRGDLETELERIVRELARRHPRHGGAALLMAELEGRSGTWPEVVRLLGQADLQDLEDDDGRLCHFHHLLGLAHLREGRTDEALAAFEQGVTYERGTCMLQPLIHLTRPMSDPPEPHEHDLEQPVVRQLLGAIRLADRALAAGDPAGSLAALDFQAMWHQAEPQSAARLAAAYLEIPSASPVKRYHKRLALALFLHACQTGERALVEILLPGLSWDETRLAEVESRARAWLES